jgi:Zn-dependent protease with chaperone function
VMIGLGIAWIVVSIIAMIITIPVVVVTSIIAAIVAAIPGLLLVGLFSTFLSGPLPWIGAALFVLPLFFLIAFSPWLLLGSWQTVYTSTVWTLTYREIKALPAIAPQTEVVPVGD